MNVFALGTSEELTWADFVGIGLVLLALVLGSALVYRFAPAAGRPMP